MIPFAELAAGHYLDSLVKKKGTDAYDEWFKRKKWCLDYWLQLFHKCLRRVAAENFQVLPMEDANYRIHYVEAIHLNVFSFVKWLKLIFCSLEKESWRYQEISRESQMNWNGLTRLLSFQSYHTGQMSFPYRKEELRNYFQFQNCKTGPEITWSKHIVAQLAE